MSGPPHIERLDFSQFHPLDHAVWACRGYPGGRRRHLTLWWDYRARDALLGPVRRVACRLGHHQYTEYWRPQQGQHGHICWWCGDVLKDEP